MEETRRIWIGRQAFDDEDQVFIDDGTFNAWELFKEQCASKAGWDPKEYLLKEYYGTLPIDAPEFYLNQCVTVTGHIRSLTVT